MVLRVVGPPDRAPMCAYDEARGGFYGFNVDLLPILLKAAGINDTFEIRLTPDNLVESTLAAFDRNEADMSIFPLVPAANVFGRAIPTAAVHSGGLQLLVRRPVTERDDVFAFLTPFKAELWLCIVFTAFIVYLVWVLMAKLSPLGAYTVRRIRRIDQPHAPVKEYAIESEAESFLLESWMALVGQALIPRGRSWAVWIVSLSWGFFGIIVLAAYTANLAAILTDATAEPEFNSLEDLLRKDGTYAQLNNSQQAVYMKTSADPIIQLLQGNAVDVPHHHTGYEMVRSGEVDAMIAFDSFLLPFMAKAPCDTEVVGVPFGVGFQALGLPMNSTLLPAINKAIVELGETGVLDDLSDKWLFHSDTCEMPAVLLDPPQARLGVSTFRGLFYMTFFFGVLAIILTGLERLTLMVFHRQPSLHARVERVMENVLGDGSTVFHEGHEAHHCSSDAKTDALPITSNVRGTPGLQGCLSGEESKNNVDEDMEHAVLNSLQLARFY